MGGVERDTNGCLVHPNLSTETRPHAKSELASKKAACQIFVNNFVKPPLQMEGKTSYCNSAKEGTATACTVSSLEAHFYRNVFNGDQKPSD